MGWRYVRSRKQHAGSGEASVAWEGDPTPGPGTFRA